MMTLTAALTESAEKQLRGNDEAFAAEFPGEPGTRQPVHTFYGGANLFAPGVCQKMGKLALRSLEENGPLSAFADETMWRVREKLRTEPIEDYRIDFEDGYGIRPDDEEDGHAEMAARNTAEAMESQLLPPFFGIRVKPFTAAHRKRAFRTLDIFLTTLLTRTGGAAPANFVVTLPKVTSAMEVASLADLLDILEERLSVAAGSLKLEFMVETPQCLFILPELLSAARGRCIAAHLGAYDLTAALGVTAPHQTMLHPACDFARLLMKTALADRGIFLSDGGTNIMPVGDRASVHAAWYLHACHIRHSLMNGFYQGWDLHPAQLVSRYAAVYSFFRESLAGTRARLRNFQERAGQATLTGNVFDDAATGLGLASCLRRAVDCGAVTEEEAYG